MVATLYSMSLSHPGQAARLKVDGLIADGTIGGHPPNAADFQIATTVRALLAFQDLRDRVDGRPAAELARRIQPGFPGDVPPMLPPEWLREAV